MDQFGDGGATLYLPPGSYKITQSLTMGCGDIHARVFYDRALGGTASALVQQALLAALRGVGAGGGSDVLMLPVARVGHERSRVALQIQFVVVEA